MNLNYLQSSLDYVNYSGMTLSNERVATLQNSLIVLQNENHFQQTFLWGQIYGIDNDYFIAYGYEKDALLERVFYYSTNCLDWGIMPRAKKPTKDLTILCTTQFQGDPALVVKINDDGPVRVDPNAEGGGDVGGAELKEEDRLAAIISMINEDAAVVPRGALFKRPDSTIVSNVAFSGLKGGEEQLLKSYVHYRRPRKKWNTNLLSREDYNFALDFLDTLDDDIPHPSWAFQMEITGRLATLRSLHWHGMTFYHCIGTPNHGFMYVGNGRRNMDIPFMI